MRHQGYGRGAKEIASLESLTVLLLGGTQVTDVGLKQIARLPNLTCLSLCGATRISDEGLKELARLPKLAHLDLSFNLGVTDRGVKNTSPA